MAANVHDPPPPLTNDPNSPTTTHPTTKRDFSEGASSHSPSSQPSSAPSKRRRTTTSTSNTLAPGTSSRGVANLTPEQLAKKRANDREAQRAIRERTKNQIESLERKIRELTQQQPYQELQNVLRQKELVEQENVEIRKRLSSVMSLIQPFLGVPPSHHVDTPYTAPVPPYIPGRPLSANRNIGPPSAAPSPAPSHWQPAPSAPMQNNHVQHDPRNFASHAQQQLNQQRHDMTHNLDMGPERLGLDFLLDGTQRINRIPNGLNGTHDHDNFQQAHQRRGSDASGHVRNGSVGSHGGYGTPGADITGHSAPIRNGPPTCPLDSLLLDFLYERQQQAAEGVETPKLVGPAYPSVSSLLNPARGANSHPLSKVFTDILATFPDLSTLPEKVAVLYIMFLIMRWQISPTQENYDRLPEWVTPRPSQLFTPHPAWIDHLPWPKMRDRLVRDYNPRDYLFDNFFIPFTTTMSVNWPYEPTDALLSSAGDEDLMINPVFERHLRRLENWSLGPEFARAFPGLRDTYRLKTDGDRRS